jgi:hypothetical protein
MIKKEIQLHVDAHIFGNQLGMVYTAFREVDINKSTSLQEFLNRMMDIGVIIPIELAKWERSKVSSTKKPAKSWFSLAIRQIMGKWAYK